MEEELSPKQHFIGFETPNLSQTKWFVQEILDAQVKVGSYVQSELNSCKAKIDILLNKN
jgi:hypothetical protein